MELNDTHPQPSVPPKSNAIPCGKAPVKLIAVGLTPTGYISIGVVPMGVLAIGIVPMGVISMGVVAMGTVAAGVVSMGIAAFGGETMSLLNLGRWQIGGIELRSEPHHSSPVKAAPNAMPPGNLDSPHHHH